MGDTGYNWSEWAYVPITDGGTGDWDGNGNENDIADNETDTSDAVSLDNKAACEISVTLIEDNTGVIDGVVTVFILGDIDGTQYEETTLSGARSFTITPVQNDSVFKNPRGGVDPARYGSFKIAILNEGGQTLQTKVRYRTATIPVAS